MFMMAMTTLKWFNRLLSYKWRINVKTDNTHAILALKFYLIFIAIRIRNAFLTVETSPFNPFNHRSHDNYIKRQIYIQYCSCKRKQTAYISSLRVSVSESASALLDALVSMTQTAICAQPNGQQQQQHQPLAPTNTLTAATVTTNKRNHSEIAEISDDDTAPAIQPRKLNRTIKHIKQPTSRMTTVQFGTKETASGLTAIARPTPSRSTRTHTPNDVNSSHKHLYVSSLQPQTASNPRPQKRIFCHSSRQMSNWATSTTSNANCWFQPAKRWKI